MSIAERRQPLTNAELAIRTSRFTGDTTKNVSQLCKTCQKLQINDLKFAARGCCDRGNPTHPFFLHLGLYQTLDERGARMQSFLQTDFETKDILPDLPSLSASEAQGCSFCAALKSALQHRGSCEKNSKKIEIRIEGAQYQWNSPIKDPEEDIRIDEIPLQLLVLSVKVGHSSPFALGFQISAPSGECASWLNIKRQPLLEYASWKYGNAMLKSWISEHVQGCAHCQKNPTTGKAPTRLIDLGPLSDVVEPRLIITNDCLDVFGSAGKRSSRYLILSYCWGDLRGQDTSFLTNKKNFHQRCSRIPLASFPQTCRDAIHVTKSLGFRYIWIDAFCIIQDDEKDWLEESLKMADAYSNAFLTIIPLESSSSHDGFLHRRPGMTMIPFKSAIRPEVQGEYAVHEVLPESKKKTNPSPYARFVLGKTEYYDMYEKDVHPSKWYQRGWTFQEALMSPRKLFFGEQSLYFNCCGTIHSDSSGESFSSSEILDNYANFQSKMNEGLEKRTKRDIFSDLWYNVIYPFTGRQFSNPKDRFPAISSLAQIVRNITKDDYVAGLWSSDLRRGALWVKKSKSRDFKTHQKTWFSFGREGGEYVAPSWSWVSSNGPTEWDMWVCISRYEAFTDFDGDIYAKVELQHGSANPYGLIRSGRLFVTTTTYHSRSMNLEHCKDWWVFTSTDGFEARIKFDWDIPLGDNKCHCISDWTQDQRERYKETCGPIYDMRLIPLGSGKPGLIEVHGDVDKRLLGVDPFGERVIGLVVVPALDQTDDEEVWMRAGIFESDKPGGCSEVKKFFQSLKEKTFIII